MLLFLVVVALIAGGLWHFTSERLAVGFLIVAAIVAVLLLASDSARF